MRIHEWTKLGIAAALLTASILPDAPARASSHREAPLIGSDPCADNVDVYAFVSPDTPNTVTLIATYIPLEEPNGGPNFYQFCDDVLYEIKVDRNGDAVEDASFQFRFKTSILNPNTFNYNLGQITSPSAAPLTFKQDFTMTLVDSGGAHVIGTGPVAPANLGPRSYANYDNVWSQAITTLNYQGKSIKVFAGPVDDPFYVDLGAVFDLVGIRGSTVPDNGIPGSSGGLVMGGAGGGNVGQHGGGFDGLAGYNTHAIAIQVPFALVANPAADLANLKPYDAKSVMGVWATASRPRVTVRRAGARVADTHGQWVQVSRLGFPLVNELLIPLAKKDVWNTGTPSTDLAPYGNYILDPEPANDAAVLYPSFFGPGAPFDTAALKQNGMRADMLELVKFLPSVFCNTAPTQAEKTACMNGWNIAPADLLRLNLAVPPTAPASVNRMGALAGDFGGFPNGRRLVDDIVDAAEQVVIAGALVHFAAGQQWAPLGDGVDQNDKSFRTAFPYLATPHQGYIRQHTRYEPVH
ncbi:MAG TPA: DUF4331 domain-containing protein [Polyangia bacterium]|nr:DUF4331 domain-containing protein [Polyangia bacterium]